MKPVLSQKIPVHEQVYRRLREKILYGELAPGQAVTIYGLVDELDVGNHPCKSDCLKLPESLPVLSVPDPIADIVETYIEHQLMPRDPTGDALHLAIASYHHCRFLLTWNCAHLANANKQEHIRHVNALLGLHVPVLTTPLELMESGGPLEMLVNNTKWDANGMSVPGLGESELPI